MLDNLHTVLTNLQYSKIAVGSILQLKNREGKGQTFLTTDGETYEATYGEEFIVVNLLVVREKTLGADYTTFYCAFKPIHNMDVSLIYGWEHFEKLGRKGVVVKSKESGSQLYYFPSDMEDISVGGMIMDGYGHAQQISTTDLLERYELNLVPTGVQKRYNLSPYPRFLTYVRNTLTVKKYLHVSREIESYGLKNNIPSYVSSNSIVEVASLEHQRNSNLVARNINNNIWLRLANSHIDFTDYCVPVKVAKRVETLGATGYTAGDIVPVVGILSDRARSGELKKRGYVLVVLGKDNKSHDIDIEDFDMTIV